MAGEKPGRHFDATSPRGYYLDYSRYADAVRTEAKSGSVAVRQVGGGELSPLLLARSALGSLEVYLGGGRAELRDRFELLSRWLIENMELVPLSFGGWSMPASKDARRLPDGWFSGTAHAECLSAAKAIPLAQLTALRLAEPEATQQLEATSGPLALLDVQESARCPLPIDAYIDCMGLWE